MVCYNSNDASLLLMLMVAWECIRYFNDTSFVVNDGFAVEGLTSGMYSFRVSDDNGCFSVIDTTITSADTLLYSITDASDFNGFSASCYGSEDAFLNTSVSGGVGPYDYSFNGGVSYISSNTINEYLFENLSSGEMVFQVKDENECIASIGYELTSPAEIIPSLSLYSSIDCNGNDDGALLAEVQGGVSEFTYSLSSNGIVYSEISSEPSYLFQNLTAGFYELNIIDQNGCSNTLSNSSQFIVDEPDAITFDLIVNEISCTSSNDAEIEISNISGGIGFTFKLYDSFGYYFTQEDLGSFDLLSFDSLVASSYILVLTGTQLWHLRYFSNRKS